MGTKGRDSSRYQVFSRRALLLGGIQLAGFGVLGLRMYDLQILDRDRYKMLADENRINVRLLPPLRGRVTDRFGTVVAGNHQNYRVVLMPEQTQDVDRTLDLLSRIVEISDRDRRRILRDVDRSPGFMPITVAENLTWDQFAQINVNEPYLPGLQPDVGESRVYPFGPELAHVIGYVGAVTEAEIAKDNDPLLKLPEFKVGKSGIERGFDKDLRGTAGSSQVEVNAYGRVIRELEADLPHQGGETVLTLDMEVQSYVWNRLQGQSASVVVMDVNSGDIVAMASCPAYDPNMFVTGLSHAEWKKLVEDEYHPLINKSIGGLYPPGSTFKPVVAMAALEAGFDPTARVFCSGKYQLGDATFHCWKKQGHGAMNMHEAIKHSCDVYFYDVARRIGIDAIAAMAERFGFGQAYDFGIPGGKAGVVPSTEWKKKTYKAKWLAGETLNVGIGQGYMLTTPLQLAIAAARIANGGRPVVPRLVRSVGGQTQAPPPLKDPGFKPEWLSIVQGGMYAVMNDQVGGTAYRSRLRIPGVEMAGKTGTAQVRRISKAERVTGVIKNENLEWRQRDHALFMCYAPVAAPQYAISVIIEHGGSGSGMAAPVARDIMEMVLQRDPVRLQSYVTPGAAAAREPV